MIEEAILEVVKGRSLTGEGAQGCMAEIMDGQATPVQIAGLVTALKMKGETAEEIAGFVRAMRARAVRVPVAESVRTGVVDTCGTGGDRLNTFNISTAAAFVAAGAGVRVAKHGNRAMSSACGSADVLEALGVRLDLPPERVARAVEEVGIGFMFAQALHPAMRYAAPVRRELGIRTVFNILGPLTNPAGALRQVIGVFDPALVHRMAQALHDLGSEYVFVVHGSHGLDEISTLGETLIARLTGGQVRTMAVHPEDFGLRRAAPEEIAVGGSPESNARILRSVLSGEPGPCREIVLMNAAAAIVAGGLADTLPTGLEMAAASIDTRAALRALTSLIAFSRSP
ncbi:MAG: anthranilate phosphoribosyltransferase [Armatimonadetes bacterium]|nr:anthranilate phosphoribosyltransferase [Armatimonadota bacterium]